MKAADGITGGLRATALAKVQLVTGWYESNTQGIIEEACMQWAMAEERERVLRDALEEIRELAMTFALVGNESQRALSESVIGILRRAALATPAAEHPAEKGSE